MDVKFTYFLITDDGIYNSARVPYSNMPTRMLRITECARRNESRFQWDTLNSEFLKCHGWV